MTGKVMLDKALRRLCYGALSGNTRITNRSIEVINEIYADLYYCLSDEGFSPITSLDDVIDLPERLIHGVMPYGICMLLAEGESDGDNQQFYATKYTAARQSIKSTGYIVDKMPKGADL